jgi:UDP-GlcNAc:undecaprenyl-phosphate GlcNAc-1-phosphate transferase
MFLLGMVDDLRALGARRKLLIQVFLGLVAWQAGIRIEQFKLPLLGSFVPLGPLALPVTLFWLVAMTNLINLIDGIDGLAGGIGVLLMALLAWVGMGTGNGFYSLLCLGLLGALLGFLRFNFPPARIYMGDGGAYFLGFFIGLLSIETSNKGTVVAALAAPVLALALPILDTSLALVRRATKGLPLFRPDQEHIHHRLLRRVGDKRQVLLLLYALCAVATSFALALYLQDGRYMAVMTGVGGVVVVWSLQSLQAVPRLRSVWPIFKAHLRLRRHSRQLLRLAGWLEAEAEHSRSLDELWTKYERLAARLGVDGIRASVDGEDKSWPSPAVPHEAACWRRRHSWTTPRLVEIEFLCRPDKLTLDEFEHVASLAGEAWHKAVLRWDRLAAVRDPRGIVRRISMREQLRTAAEPPMRIKAAEAD